MMTRKPLFACRNGLAIVLTTVLAIVMGLAALPAAGQQRDGDQGRRNTAPGAFDFYVLSLSWSPTFCAAQKNGGPAQQCGVDKDYGFVVHGLWPQNERGYPEFCASSEPGRVPQALGQTLFDIMPSMGLIGHQWRKHGTCSGLSQRDYLAAIRLARDHVTMPSGLRKADAAQTLSADGIEDAFVAANPGLDRRAISLTCEAGRLEEVRICMNRDFGFRACPELDRRGCSTARITLPAAR